MQHFRLGNSTSLYSKAFAKFRRQQAGYVIPWVLAVLGLAVLAAAAAALIRYLRNTRARMALFIDEARRYARRREKQRKTGKPA